MLRPPTLQPIDPSNDIVHDSELAPTTENIPSNGLKQSIDEYMSNKELYSSVTGCDKNIYTEKIKLNMSMLDTCINDLKSLVTVKMMNGKQSSTIDSQNTASNQNSDVKVSLNKLIEFLFIIDQY